MCNYNFKFISNAQFFNILIDICTYTVKSYLFKSIISVWNMRKIYAKHDLLIVIILNCLDGQEIESFYWISFAYVYYLENEIETGVMSKKIITYLKSNEN